MHINKKMVSALIAGSFLLVGCGYQTVAPDQNSVNRFKGKSITYVHRNYPVRPYVQYSTIGIIPGTEIINAVGGVASTAVSASQAKKSGGVVYARPSEELSKKIIALLKKKYKLRYKPNQLAPLGADKKPNYQAYPTDYVLDIETEWSLSQLNFLGYDMLMNNHIKVIDRKQNKAVLQYSCNYESILDKHLHGKSDFLANHGKILKQVTARALEQCLTKFKQNVLK